MSGNEPGQPSLPAGVLPVLTSRDILTHEPLLRSLLGRFAPYKSCRLHFPPPEAEVRAEWIAHERRLLIPLRGTPEEGLLGLFSAGQVLARAGRGVAPLIENIASLCLDQIRLLKAAVTDAATGLPNRDHFINAVSAEIEAVRRSATAGRERTAEQPEEQNPHAPSVALPAISLADGHRAGFGIIVLRLSGLREVARDHGYDFFNRLLGLLGAELLDRIAGSAVAGRTGEFELAVLTPGASAAACRRLAETIVAGLGGVSAPCSVTGELVGVRMGCGLAMFPADADPNAVAYGTQEQTLRLLRRARKAAAVASEPENSAIPVLPFSRILAEGGHVQEIHPFSRLTVSLGLSSRAAEGQRFAVWGAPGPGSGPYKGDIVLVTVRESASEAEILHLDDPAAPIRPGDRLSLLTDAVSRAREPRPRSEEATLDPASGFPRHRDFLNRFYAASRTAPAFCLALVRISLPGLPHTTARADEAVALVARRCRELFTPEALKNTLPDAAKPSKKRATSQKNVPEENLLGGRYGLNSLILFHPGLPPADARARYETLVRSLAEEHGIEAGVGIAPHPLLDFRKADALENSVHALEYALLLPFPRVGVLDSLGLTVHADSLLNQGDSFGAIAMYKQALLADADNQTARNSLAVCLAGLGRHAEAERHFSDVLKAQPRNAHARYNLGTIYQAMGDTSRARKAFRLCLRHAPDHIFACLRLGQLAEAEGALERARQWYGRAEQLPGGHGLTRRHFAALALKRGKSEEARRLLYDALAQNSMDGAALDMLAHLYLDEGEAPSLAEALARQSVAVRPESPQSWLTLARALEAMGKEQEAAAAKARARGRRPLDPDYEGEADPEA